MILPDTTRAQRMERVGRLEQVAGVRLVTLGDGLERTTCGIDHALFMTEDDAATYGYPPRKTKRYGLHGRVSSLRRGELIEPEAGEERLYDLRLGALVGPSAVGSFERRVARLREEATHV